jgi:hypothetical protein
MWLKRHQQKNAGFYWEQASSFFHASRNLPNTSSPLTLYYCFLNAVKALLVVRKVAFAELHGVSGETLLGKTSLAGCGKMPNSHEFLCADELGSLLG